MAVYAHPLNWDQFRPLEVVQDLINITVQPFLGIRWQVLNNLPKRDTVYADFLQ